MSRRSIEDLRLQLESIRAKKTIEKKLFVSIDKEKYNKFLTAVVLSSDKNNSIEKTYKKIINNLIDNFIDSVDFYDLTQEDIDTIADMFDEII